MDIFIALLFSTMICIFVSVGLWIAIQINFTKDLKGLQGQFKFIKELYDSVKKKDYINYSNNCNCVHKYFYCDLTILQRKNYKALLQYCYEKTKDDTNEMSSSITSFAVFVAIIVLLWTIIKDLHLLDKFWLIILFVLLLFLLRQAYFVIKNSKLKEKKNLICLYISIIS